MGGIPALNRGLEEGVAVPLRNRLPWDRHVRKKQLAPDSTKGRTVRPQLVSGLLALGVQPKAAAYGSFPKCGTCPLMLQVF